MSKEFRIAELLCTRLCHDLTGPIGAVNNGAEFLSEEGFNMQNQAVELIVSSAFQAVSRLQFYRFAYGRVKDSGEASLTDMRKLANDFFVGSKITLNWSDEFTDGSGVSASNRLVRLLFNLMMIASAALLKGGSLTIKMHDDDGARALDVIAEGDVVKWDVDYNAALEGQLSIDQLTPKNVQYHLTHDLLSALHMRLAMDASERSLALRAVETVPTPTA